MIILLTGLQGSGKTEVAKFLSQKIPNTIIINNDEVRKELFGVEGGKGYSPNQKTLMDSTVAQRTTDAIVKNQTVILDRMSPTVADRQLIKDLAATLGTEYILIALSSSRSLTEERINERLNKDPLGVPFTVYLLWVDRFETATDAEYEIVNDGSLADLEKTASAIALRLK